MGEAFQLLVNDKSVTVTLYTGCDDPDLPDYIKALPMNVRSQWVSVYNYAVMDYKDAERAAEEADRYTTISVEDLAGMATKEVATPVVVTPPVLSVHPAVAITPPVLSEPTVTWLERFKTWLGDGFDKSAVHTAAPAVGAAPVQQTEPFSLFHVYKGTDDRLRTLLVYSNNFKDKENEIISAAAHKEYVEAAEAGQALYPDLHLWHGGPATKWGTVETVSYVDGFAVAGGVVDAGKEHVALTLKELADKGEIAVSFGFYGLRGPDRVYQLYRPFEISPLLAGSEANPWTSVDVSTKESSMAFSDKKKDWLKTHFRMDDAAITTAEAKFETMATSLKAAGIDYKEDDYSDSVLVARDPTPTPPQPAPPQPTPPVPAPPVPAPPQPAPAQTDDMNALMFKQMTAIADVLNGMGATIKALQDDLKTYKEQDGKTVAERANDQVLARIASAGIGFSPASSASTVQPGLKEQAADDWLDQALGGVLVLPALDGGAVVGHANGGDTK